MKLNEWLRKIFIVKRAVKPPAPKIYCENCFYHLKTNYKPGLIDKAGVYHIFLGGDDCAHPKNVREPVKGHGF